MWECNAKRPDAVLLDLQLDFVKYYSEFVAKSDTLHGYTKTFHDPACVSAFRVMRTGRGTVEVYFKASAGLSMHWRGLGGKEMKVDNDGTPG